MRVIPDISERDTEKLDRMPSFEKMDYEELLCYTMWLWYESTRAKRERMDAVRSAAREGQRARRYQTLALDLWAYLGGDEDRCAGAVFGTAISEARDD